MPTRQGASRSIKGTAVTDVLHTAPHNAAEDPLYVTVTNPSGSEGLTDAQLRASPVPVQTELDSKTLDAVLEGTDLAAITHSVIQGRTTGGGGGFRDVKVTPSGALTVEAAVTGTVTVAGTVAIEEPVTVEGTVNVGNFPAQTGLTDAQLRASPVPVGDDYASGELLEDQVGANNVLVFTFSQPVASFWVAPQGLSGTCKIDHYGGEPSATRGIPVDAGGALPIPEPATVVRVFTPTGLRVTVWGQRRG